MKILSWALCVLMVAMYAPQNQAQTTVSQRDKTWEAALGARHLHSSDMVFNGGSSIRLDGATGIGFSVGYNFNSALNLSFSADSSTPNYDLTIVSATGDPADQFSGEFQLSRFALGLTYHMLPGPVTPFVAASAGVTHIDTDIQSGPPLVGCFWDPWWGYVCDYVVPTHQADDASYAAALGIRWDVNPRVFLRAAYGREWLDIGHGAGLPHTDLWKIDFGFKQ